MDSQFPLLMKTPQGGGVIPCTFTVVRPVFNVSDSSSITAFMADTVHFIFLDLLIRKKTHQKDVEPTKKHQGFCSLFQPHVPLVTEKNLLIRGGTL